MRRSTGSVQAPVAGEDNLLPRELWWLYLAAPWIASPVLNHELDGSVASYVVSSLTLYVPFLGIPAVCHAVYAWVMPALLRRLSPSWRYPAHAVAITLAAVLGAVAVSPVFGCLVTGAGLVMLRPRFIVTSVIVTWTFMFPSLLVQQLRARGRAAERQSMAARQLALEMQLQSLQARANPHFFFNSLNTIASLIPEQPELAERTIEQLAEVFRYALDSGRMRMVPFGREVSIVRDYLAIQSARFGGNLRYEVTVDDACTAIEVPPLVLQPLVENAVLHGLANRGGAGSVRVEARIHEGLLRVSVCDDGPGPGASQHAGTGTAMRDLRERLAIIYGGNAALATGHAQGGGFLVHLDLPMQVST